MTAVQWGGQLLDRCPRCRRVDYVPQPELRALCRCGLVYQRSWRPLADIGPTEAGPELGRAQDGGSAA